jgi:hypothetical protein
MHPPPCAIEVDHKKQEILDQQTVAALIDGERNPRCIGTDPDGPRQSREPSFRSDQNGACAAGKRPKHLHSVLHYVSRDCLYDTDYMREHRLARSFTELALRLVESLQDLPKGIGASLH